MIIDARLATTSKNGRPFTVSAAVANALDAIEIGKCVTVDLFTDATGKNMNVLRLSVAVSQQKGDRRFTVRQCKDGALATITRLG